MPQRHFGGCYACLEKAPHEAALLESGQNGGFASIYTLSNGVNINKRMSVCVSGLRRLLQLFLLGLLDLLLGEWQSQ